MNVWVTPQLAAMVREQVPSGGYHNASEVVRDALRSRERQVRRLTRLRGSFQDGEDSGEPIEWRPERHEAVLVRERGAIARGERPNSDVCP